MRQEHCGSILTPSVCNGCNAYDIREVNTLFALPADERLFIDRVQERMFGTII